MIKASTMEAFLQSHYRNECSHIQHEQLAHCNVEGALQSLHVDNDELTMEFW